MEPVLFVTNLPTPYRLPLYRRMSGMLGERGRALHVLFLGYAKSERQWRIDREEMEGFDHSFCSPDAGPLRGAIAAVETMKPSVVIISWAMDMTALRLLLHCRRRGIPTLVVSGETSASASGNPFPRLRQIFRRPFFSMADGFITYGIRSTEYLLASGVPRAKIHTGINAVDTDFFREEVDRCRSDGSAVLERERYRMENGGPFLVHLLFVGYLQPYKGVACAIDAMRRLGRAGIALHIVGAGPEERSLADRVAASGLSRQIFFHGYRQQEELPLYYALADLLLFPSLADEVFGLVLVEGAAAGLPIVASRLAGGTPDVVEDGANGVIVDPTDADEFARGIARLADDAALRERMGRESRRRAMERLTIERSAKGYVDAIRLHE